MNLEIWVHGKKLQTTETTDPRQMTMHLQLTQNQFGPVYYKNEISFTQNRILTTPLVHNGSSCLY